jgi:hypothetical protein
MAGSIFPHRLVAAWRRFVSRLPEPGASRLAVCHGVGVVEQAGHLVVRLIYRSPVR